MRRTVVTIGLVAVMLLSVSYAFAQGPGFRPGMGAGRGDGPHWGKGPGWESRDQDKALNLTPEQKTKLNELRTKFRGENAQLIGAMVTKKIELQSLWSNPKADDKAIQDKAKEVRDLQNQMKEKAVLMRLEARKILTPEQISKWGAGRGFGHGHGPGSGGGRGHGFGGGFGGGCGRGFGAFN
jgi:Spy/CpxP family protein refolding chaperone